MASAVPEVRSFGIPFFHIPSVGPDKSPAEAEHLRLLQGNVDFIRDGNHTIVFA